ncbi:hypothetical protein QVD17_42317 [Tagetes erecta]|uniref:Uncharacterized protein n=1 Tax=Tagetes erecta TaxID=13708 RepID=A0AAD8NFD1_TARER|nr:hypothetical protein QVD17_42317 [Tagetes erecta]
MPSLKYFLSLGEDVLLPIGGSKKKVASVVSPAWESRRRCNGLPPELEDRVRIESGRYPRGMDSHRANHGTESRPTSYLSPSPTSLIREERSTLRKGAGGESIKSLLIRYELRALRHSGMLITSLYDSGTCTACVAYAKQAGTRSKRMRCMEKLDVQDIKNEGKNRRGI